MEDKPSESDKQFGETLALVLGVLLLLGGALNALAGGEIVVTAILVLTGAAMLGGWTQARRKRRNRKT